MNHGNLKQWSMIRFSKKIVINKAITSKTNVNTLAIFFAVSSVLDFFLLATSSLSANLRFIAPGGPGAVILFIVDFLGGIFAKF